MWPRTYLWTLARILFKSPNYLYIRLRCFDEALILHNIRKLDVDCIKVLYICIYIYRKQGKLVPSHFYNFSALLLLGILIGLSIFNLTQVTPVRSLVPPIICVCPGIKPKCVGTYMSAILKYFLRSGAIAGTAAEAVSAPNSFCGRTIH